MKRIAFLFLLVGVATAVGAQQMGGQGMAGDRAGSMMGSGQSGMGQMGGQGQMGAPGQMGAQGQMGGQGMMGQAATPFADGEIRKVNKDAKKITIRHGAIPHMDMPPMTMVYQVKDPAMLDQVKAGDKVKFVAEKVGGAYVVTRIEPLE